ncbi:MAG: DUF5995 family protein [Bacteroidales bacterium]|nr:DUF5995 family protein [Bacteroidales bacterium]
MNKANTIEEVLEKLDIIIAESVKNNDQLGYFAYIYRRTTAQIKQAIIDKKFEDNERMEKFDVEFATKYLQAYRDFHEGRPVCRPWAVAFDIKITRLTVLQHIILGMNAHINYDLGMTASEFSENGRIDDLKNDFMRVNDVLASLVDELQVKVGRVSRLMFLLDWIGKRSDEAVMNFSMEKARQQAWNFGKSLVASKEHEKKLRMSEVEEFTGNLGELVKHPPGRFFKFIIRLIYFFEVRDVKKVITELEAEI